MDINIIPCSNGLGHITRSLKLSYLLKKEFNWTILLPKRKKVKKLNNEIKIKRIDQNFKIKKKNIYNINWYKKLNFKFKSSDLIISDNLPEIILQHKKTIIIANFFWHQIFETKNNFFTKLKRLIIKDNIKIISNYLFCNIQSFKKNIIKVGFIGKFKKSSIKEKKGILISFGTSNIGFKKKNFSIDLLKDPSFKDITFYIDKNLLNNQKITLSKNIKIAKFDSKMYDDIRVAIIKPGFGTINECVERGISIVSIINSDNKEFIFNSKIIKKRKIGKYFYSINLGFNAAITAYNDYKELKKIYLICKNFRWNGEKEILNLIKNL